MSWLRASGNGVLLTLHIQPGAKKTEVVGLHGDALKLRLAAPPVDGKANETLIAFLADRLDVSKSQLSLVSGQTSRSKRVAISDMITTEVERKLCPAGKAG
jgi:uncharacterized protein (TIGR00251 family)